jgi:SsrA-binding protein
MAKICRERTEDSVAALLSREERRRKRFDTLQPLAPHPRKRFDTLQPLAPHPRKRFDTLQPLAPHPRKRFNTLQPLPPHPRKRFITLQPLPPHPRKRFDTLQPLPQRFPPDLPPSRPPCSPFFALGCRRSMAANKPAQEKGTPRDKSEKLIVKNRRATFDYSIEEHYEGGLVLVGSEVKSMRAGKVDVVDAFASVDNDEMYLKQLYVAPFEQAKAFPHEPRRSRKVLLHKHEIEAIDKAVSRGGYTVIPLRLYFKGGRVKVELGLAKGKKTHDKRQDIARKTDEREARAAIARRGKGD